jgi:hypothetical protein
MTPVDGATSGDGTLVAALQWAGKGHEQDRVGSGQGELEVHLRSMSLGQIRNVH